MSKTKNNYSAEFKQQAIQLATTGNTTLSQIARDLGIHNQMLSRWVREYKQNKETGRPSFTGRGRVALSEQEKVIRDLRRENEILKQEREILKLAAKFFAKESK